MSDLTYEEAAQKITGPGSPFELAVENVGRFSMPVFKNRFHSLREVLKKSVEFGEAELAVWDTGERWTFTEHERLVASIAAAMAEKHGIGPGSRVAILASNSPEWVLAAWATIVLGGSLVAMNGWWQKDEIRYGLELADPDLLFADRARLARLEGEEIGIESVVFEDAIS